VSGLREEWWDSSRRCRGTNGYPFFLFTFAFFTNFLTKSLAA
jgi:hypothetical protein